MKQTGFVRINKGRDIANRSFSYQDKLIHLARNPNHPKTFEQNLSKDPVQRVRNT